MGKAGIEHKLAAFKAVALPLGQGDGPADKEGAVCHSLQGSIH